MKKILFCILVLLILVACKKAVVEEESIVEEPPEVVLPPQPEPEVVPEVPVETVTKLEMVSEARCIDDKIEIMLANPTAKTITLAKDAKIILNGLVVVDPECDKLELEPGESTICSDISGHLSIGKGKVNRIQINMYSERSLSYVDCPEE